MNFDRNLVVTAGAGTGKTTLLSRRIVNLLIKDPPIPPWRIAALTFTKKAAAEMAEKVRQELRSLLEQKGVPDAERRLAQEALSNIERMEISTIHAFAGMLLRLFPLEAEVDPNFNEDESGERFERFFEKEWEAWLEEELGRESENPRRDLWRMVLSETTLPALSAAARSLCDELIPLDALTTEENEMLAATAALLVPFTARVRRGFAESGALSFEGLIARARDLLAQNPEIRERMKERYDAILVDEFQDTDPIQYEIILYLAEEPGQCADRIPDIRLAPGKLFIVGDPKQSIYSFRHADLAAYERVKGMILEQGGMLLDLSVNFRSSREILDCVNGLFSSERMGLVPPYQPLTFGRGDEGGGGAPVLLRLLESDLPAAESAQAEARSLARFLSEEVIGRERIVSEGEEHEVRPGDVAILFPAMTHVGSFVRALREEGLPFVVEGSRTFYGATEVITMVNLLRVVVDSADQIALLGLLRSPLIALSDREIARIAAAGFFRGEKCPLPPEVDLLLETIRDLREELARLPLSEWVQSVLEKTPLLAACAIEGEHAIANISKLLRLAEESDGDPQMTPLSFIRLLSRRVKSGEPAGESPLGEENVDAIRLLTIHKAKGLEFSYLILASLGSTMPNRPPALAGFNWEEGPWFSLMTHRGRLESAAAKRAASSRKRVREEERKRLLYVGMTRARERLILSGAAGKRGNSLLSVLREVLEDRGIPIRVDHLPPTLPTKKRSSRKIRFSWNREIWERVRRDPAPIPLFFSPTSIPTEAPLSERVAPRAPGGKTAAEIGEIVHRLLERIDFASPEETIRQAAILSSEAHRILIDFVASPAFRRLRAAKILGREVPFALPWDEGFAALGVPAAEVVEGIIDLVIEDEKRLTVIDYKTDRIAPEEAALRTAHYRLQGLVYAEAIRRLSGKDVAGAEILFLRLGICSPVEIELG